MKYNDNAVIQWRVSVMCSVRSQFTVSELNRRHQPPRITKTVHTPLLPLLVVLVSFQHKRRFIEKFPDWSPGSRTAKSTALCH